MNGIDAACTSGQPYWIEHALGTGNPRTVLMHKYHVVIDISSVPVGSRFEVEVQMTMWNGLKRPYTTRKFVKYPDQQDQEISAENEFKQLERPQHNHIYWEIKPAVKNTTYELQWAW